MEKDFDCTQIPEVYLYCLHAQCPHAHECLRYLLTRYIPSSTLDIGIMNPVYAANHEDNCPKFHPDRLTHFGKGIVHLYDNLPHRKAKEIKSILFRYFGRSTYYRLVNGQRLVRPEEQAFIGKVFKEMGVDGEPVYDGGVDRVDWGV